MQGKRIVVTRAAHQAEVLADLLRERGAVPLLYPAIAIQPPQDTTALDNALRQAASGGFDWLVLTSANTVEVLRQRCETLSRSLAKIPAAAVGPATAAAARSALGVDVRIVPDEHVTEALVKALGDVSGRRILLPQANLAQDSLHDQLAQAGADVMVVSAYQTVMGQGGVDLPALLRSGQVDAVTFTSASTVTNCLARLRAEGGDPALLAYVVVACIGPITARTAEAAGLGPVLVPEDYTLAGLVSALLSALA